MSILGENGSGKSNMLLALKHLSVLMNGNRNDLVKTDFMPDIVSIQRKTYKDVKIPSIEMYFDTDDGIEFKYIFKGIIL